MQTQKKLWIKCPVCGSTSGNKETIESITQMYNNHRIICGLEVKLDTLLKQGIHLQF